MSVAGVTSRYRRWPWSRARAALRDVTFEVQTATVHGLVGANGAGKTTLLRLVAGLLAPVAGEVRVFGSPAGSTAVRSRVVFLPELTDSETRLRVGESLQLQGMLYGGAGKSLRHVVQECLAAVGMEEQRQRPIRRLSKGQRRRVEFAQALVPRADLLLMDEPFEGVDPVWCEALRQVLRARAASGATVILSSHQLADVEQTCDALTVLEDGQIVAGGSMDEVLGLKDQWALRLIPPPQHPVSEEQIRQALAPLEAEVDVTRPRQDLLSLLRRRGKPT